MQQPISSFFPSRKRSSEAVAEPDTDQQNKRPKIDLAANKFTGVSKPNNTANNKPKFVVPGANNTEQNAAAKVGLPDYLQENLDLILIGDNPGKYSVFISNIIQINRK
jgi:hypothetical protein